MIERGRGRERLKGREGRKRERDGREGERREIEIGRRPRWGEREKRCRGKERGRNT